MDPARFDTFVSSLTRPSSRRAALRAFAGGGLVAGLAALGLREGALACKRNGEKCSRNQAEKCCSGTCEKKGGEFRCAKAEGAFGCTNQKKTDACEGVAAVTPCPGNPAGMCLVDEKKRPFCYGVGICYACASDQTCRDLLQTPKARCIKRCTACLEEDNVTTACVAPPGAVPEKVATMSRRANGLNPAP